MSVIVLLGAGVGAGLFVVVRASRRRPVPLDQLLKLLERPAAADQQATPTESRAQFLVGGVEKRLGRLDVDLRTGNLTASNVSLAELATELVSGGT